MEAVQWPMCEQSCGMVMPNFWVHYILITTTIFHKVDLQKYFIKRQFKVRIPWPKSGNGLHRTPCHRMQNGMCLRITRTIRLPDCGSLNMTCRFPVGRAWLGACHLLSIRLPYWKSWLQSTTKTSRWLEETEPKIYKFNRKGLWIWFLTI